MENRDLLGRFTKGYKNDLPRDNKGKFRKKDKDKAMDKKQDISMIENCVDKLLEKAGL